jgi:putative SOS response-associated peptidase YedK
MCGRYYIDIDHKEFKRIIEEAEKNIYKECSTGEIYPSNIAPIYIEDEHNMKPILAKWGLPKYDGNGIVINARVETLSKRPMFKNLVDRSRCVVPASAFYEWKDEEGNKKDKYAFKKPDSLIYMAGLYDTVEQSGSRQMSMFGHEQVMDICYTIITKEADSSVSPIHDRMPLIIEKCEIEDYLEGKSIEEISENKADLEIEAVYIKNKK